MTSASSRNAGLRWLVDLRPELGPVGWQGNRGTCLSFATTAGHDHSRGLALSVEYLHWLCRAQPLGAGKIPSLVAALRNTGQPEDAQWPYGPTRDEDVEYGPPPEVIGPFHTADVALIATDATAAVGSLQAGVPPVIGLRVSHAFHRSTGIVDDDDPGTDGHAVLAVGAAAVAGDVPGSGLKAGDVLVLVRNSWGVGWGVQGHALLTPRTWNAVVLAALTVTPHRPPGTSP